jgi:hypothetical protein
VLVGRFLLHLQLRLHRDVDVNTQLLAAIRQVNVANWTCQFKFVSKLLTAQGWQESSLVEGKGKHRAMKIYVRAEEKHHAFLTPTTDWDESALALGKDILIHVG